MFAVYNLNVFNYMFMVFLIKKYRNWLLLILCILIAQLAGILGSIFTLESVTTWYLTLKKPVFSPPNWIFGPIWTFLYITIGVNLYYLVKAKSSLLKNLSIIIWSVQWFLNAVWSFVFFGFNNIALALVIIFSLWIVIAFLIIFSACLKKSYGYLLIPYFLWVSFAMILNYNLLLLNV